MMKTCSKCNQELELNKFSKDRTSKDGHYSWCKECKAEYKRINGKKLLEAQYARRENNVDYDLKRKTWNKIYYAIKTGKITKPTTCEVCGKESDNIQGHHKDYNKPFEITWCCQDCHSKLDDIRRCS